MSTTENTILAEGAITTELITIYSPVNEATTGIIHCIEINNENPATAWTLWVYRRYSSDGEPRLLYKFELEAGDRVEDTTIRYLRNAQELIAKASVDTVGFVIHGIEKVTPA